MVNKELLCKIFCRDIEITNNHLTLNGKLIKNKLVDNIVKEYKSNAKQGMTSPYSYRIINEGFKRKGMCDNEQLYELYALSDILKSNYLALLYFDAGNYVYFYNAVDTESLKDELLLWNHEFDINSFHITEYSSVLFKN